MTTFECYTSKRQQALLVIMFFTMSLAGVEPRQDGGPHQQSQSSFSVYRTFETTNHTKVTAQIGGTALLPCIVEASSPATVTWIRRSDYRLLTVGLLTYCSDERFHIEHARHKGIWDLRIKAVQREDQGIYECSLSQHPPESIFIEVTVLEAVAEIAGTPDVHIEEGSTLKLECLIVQATEQPSYVFWYHENKMVNFNLQDGYSVSTLSKPSDSLPPNQEDVNENIGKVHPKLDSFDIVHDHHRMGSNLPAASSVLLVHAVQFKHAGNYTCAPSNTRPTNVNVHVLKDKPAAMKHSNQSETAESTSSDAPPQMSSLRYSMLSIFSLTILLFGSFEDLYS